MRRIRPREKIGQGGSCRPHRGVGYCTRQRRHTSPPLLEAPMRYTIQELAARIAAAERDEDLDTLDELENCFTLRKGPAPVPFAAPVAFKATAVVNAREPLESDAALPLANALSRARRLIQYRFRRRFGGPGPVLVAEGDSWFEFPILLDDVLDHLMREFAVLSLAAAGDLLSDMAADDEFSEAIATEGADFFLLSGGGNDMLHDGRLSEFLNRFEDGMTENDVFRPEPFTAFVNQVTATY